MNQVGPRLKAALEKIMREENVDIFTACLRPDARIADQHDRKAAAKLDESKSTAEWLAGLDVTKGFEKQGDMLAAIADPLYKTSEEYRQAVRALIVNTPEETVGLVRPSRNVPDNASMIKQAQREVFAQKRSELMSKAARGDAQARLDLMVMATDPAYAGMIDEYERDYQSSHPLEMELRARQAAGERVGTNSLSGEISDASAEQHAAIAADPMGMSGKPSSEADWV